MVFNNDLSVDTDHHTAHAHVDVDVDVDVDDNDDETATLLGKGNNNSTSPFRVSRVGLVGFLIGFVALSSSAFVFLLNLQGPTLPNVTSSSSSSVSIINSINSNIDTEVMNTEQHDNFFYFVGITTGRNIIHLHISQYLDHRVTEGQPWKGPFNSSDGKILVKSGRHGSTSVANEFNKIGDGRPFSFVQQEQCINTRYHPNQTCHSYKNPKKLNFYIVVDLEITGSGTIENIAIGQSHSYYFYDDKQFNDWWIISPNCQFVYDPHFSKSGVYEEGDDKTSVYKCKLTNGKYVGLGARSIKSATYDIGHEDHVPVYNFP